MLALISKGAVVLIKVINFLGFAETLNVFWWVTKSQVNQNFNL